MNNYIDIDEDIEDSNRFDEKQSDDIDKGCISNAERIRQYAERLQTAEHSLETWKLKDEFGLNDDNIYC